MKFSRRTTRPDSNTIVGAVHVERVGVYCEIARGRKRRKRPTVRGRPANRGAVNRTAADVDRVRDKRRDRHSTRAVRNRTRRSAVVGFDVGNLKVRCVNPIVLEQHAVNRHTAARSGFVDCVSRDRLTVVDNQVVRARSISVGQNLRKRINRTNLTVHIRFDRLGCRKLRCRSRGHRVVINDAVDSGRGIDRQVRVSRKRSECACLRRSTANDRFDRTIVNVGRPCAKRGSVQLSNAELLEDVSDRGTRATTIKFQNNVVTGRDFKVVCRVICALENKNRAAAGQAVSEENNLFSVIWIELDICVSAEIATVDKFDPLVATIRGSTVVDSQRIRRPRSACRCKG